MVKKTFFSTHLSVQPHLCLSCACCCFPMGPLRVPAHFLGHPGTHLAADPLPASPLQSAGEKVSPQHSPLLWGSVGSTGPAEPQAQPQSGFSYLLLFQLQNPLVWSLLLLALSLSAVQCRIQRRLSTRRLNFHPFPPLQCDPHFLLQQGNFWSSSQPQCQAHSDRARQRWSGRGVGIGREGREVG